MNLNVVISGSGQNKNRENIKILTKGGNQREICLLTSVNTVLYLI